MKPAIHIAITHGPRQRDFLRLGILKELLAMTDAGIVIWTQATNDPVFMRECSIDPRVSVRHLPLWGPDRRQNSWLRFRRHFLRSNRLLRNAWRVERLLLPTSSYEDAFRREKPAVFVSTNPVSSVEWPLTVAAAAAGVPTLGLVRSWDHLHKRLAAYPESLGVWNEINRREAIALESMPPESVDTLGAVQFDPYFQSDSITGREEFFREIGLDPAKKTLLLATGGPAFKLVQASWLDELLSAARDGKFAFPVQIVCRTHPSDILGPFIKYLHEPDVVMEMHEEYSPTLDWVIGVPGIRRQANTLAHADVVLTPASTIALEAAIFDTPTVVIAYNNDDPEVIRKVLEGDTFIHHFKEIVDRGLVPVVRSSEEMVASINTALSDRSVFHEQRREIVRDWIGFTDGLSARRSAQAIVSVAGGRRQLRGHRAETSE